MTGVEDRRRLDELLAETGLFPSRARARDAVLRGHVTVDGVRARKPSMSVDPLAVLAANDPVGDFVSRAALKLAAGLDAFGIDPAGREALDIGASTGGFTQVLLARGARHVTAVDVGHGQMHPLVSGDPRVLSLEGLNARELERSHLGERRIALLVADVSFISLRLALPPALALAESGAEAVFLVKPQFEAGREAIGKGGLLRDPSSAERVAEDVHDWLAAQDGWRALGLVASPIEGGDGNREFLLGAAKR